MWFDFVASSESYASQSDALPGVLVGVVEDEDGVERGGWVMMVTPKGRLAQSALSGSVSKGVSGAVSRTDGVMAGQVETSRVERIETRAKRSCNSERLLLGDRKFFFSLSILMRCKLLRRYATTI